MCIRINDRPFGDMGIQGVDHKFDDALIGSWESAVVNVCYDNAGDKASDPIYLIPISYVSHILEGFDDVSIPQDLMVRVARELFSEP